MIQHRLHIEHFKIFEKCKSTNSLHVTHLIHESDGDENEVNVHHHHGPQKQLPSSSDIHQWNLQAREVSSVVLIAVHFQL